MDGIQGVEKKAGILLFREVAICKIIEGKFQVRTTPGGPWSVVLSLFLWITSNSTSSGLPDFRDEVGLFEAKFTKTSFTPF